MPTQPSLPMDSYRLAQYTVGVPCHICDGDNNFDAELCRHCFAPMALAHQSKKQKTPPRLIATLGTAGAGKTVYIGALGQTEPLPVRTSRGVGFATCGWRWRCS